MLRTIQITEKNLGVLPPNMVAVVAASVEIVPDYRVNIPNPMEIVSITIQNVGAKDCYISFNKDSDGVNYHKWLQSGQELAIPGVCRVTGWSANGNTIIAVAVWHRLGL